MAQIDLQPDPVIRERKSYSAIVATLKAHLNKWYKLTPESIHGDTVELRRRSVHSMANNHSLKIKTHVSGDDLYVMCVETKSESSRGAR